jgi:tripartite-type tricarboxylate transporter receptor subunit TctC
MAGARLVVAGIIAAAVAMTPAAAQDYPSKPIKLIVPLTPGSPVDVLTRVVTQHLAARLGQPMVVENRPGAGTTIGTRAVATSEPDGYTLLVVASSFIIGATMYSAPGYDPVNSFAAVASLVTTPQMLVIAPSVPAKTVQEFIAHAKANPGKLNFGYGQGTLPHILGESFKVITGTEIASIPYKGGAQAITDMLGGRIHMNFGTMATLLPLIGEGKIRPLAVTSNRRSAQLPEVPTMAESGLPQLSLTFWAGIVAPAGTPAAVVDKLNREVNVVMRSAEALAVMTRLGFEPQPGTPQEFATFIADEARKWPPIVKASGVKPN